MLTAKSEGRRYAYKFGCMSSLVRVKEKQATIAHYSALEEEVGKFLLLIQASFVDKFSSFRVNKSLSILGGHPVVYEG